MLSLNKNNIGTPLGLLSSIWAQEENILYRTEKQVNAKSQKYIEKVPIGSFAKKSKNVK